MAAAAAAIFRRRSSHSAVLSSFIWRRSLATQTPTASPKSSTLPLTPSQDQKAQQPPWLLVSSPDKPESRYLYDLTAKTSKDGTFIGFNREIHLPKIAGQHLIGSSQGFLLSVDKDADIHATNPLTGATLRLPSTASLPHMAGVLRDSSGRLTDYVMCPKRYRVDVDADDDGKGPQSPKLESLVFEDRRGKSKRLLCDFSRTGESNEYFCDFSRTATAIPIDGRMKSWYERAILSPSLDAVVVTYGGEQRAAFSRLGSSGSFSSLRFTHMYMFNDIIFHEGCLHAINDVGELAIFDLDNLHHGLPFFRSADRPKDEANSASNYLVESPDGKDLFLVVTILTDSMPDRTDHFLLYKLNKSTYKWKQVNSIGDIAIFVGSNHSFSLSVHDFPSLASNSVYFTSYYSTGHCNVPESHIVTGVYNLEDESSEYIELYHGSRTVNWPVPIWFMPTARTAR